jgi:type VI secretion system protein ImpG
MSATLFPYYERELTFIRQLAQEFARQHPAAAGRLLLEPNRSVDPHVERLIESFALLAARVQHKLDDEFPELTDGLLSVLYPHYLAPVPSLAVVQFDLDAARGPLPDGFRIPRHAKLNTQPVKDTVCRYRTCYPVHLWPVAVADARLMPPPFPAGLAPPPRAAAALVIKLEAAGPLPFAGLTLDALRFHLFGPLFTAGGLHELLFGHALEVVFRSTDPAAAAPPVRLPASVIRPVGYDADEGLLPYPPRAFAGYRLLTEFFAYPQKFLFADLGGFAEVRKRGFGRAMEAVVFFDRTVPSLEQAIDAGSLRLGCTPAVNLFEQTAEPIPLTRTKHEYRVVPDVARPDGCEVYSIDSVSGVDPSSGAPTEYRPFYGVRHGADGPGAFWHGTRRPSARDGDRGTEVYLNLVDLDFDPRVPSEPTLVVRTTCTNRDLPARLQRFGDAMAIDLEGAAPLKRVRAVRSPTLPLRPPHRRGRFWRLVSHLNLNHLSITDPDEGREALQEVLRLYEFTDPAVDPQHAAVVRQVIEGITGVSSRRVSGRVPGAGGGFARGVEVTVEFDAAKYTDTSAFLFATVLERFFGLYASINSFSQMVARSRHGEGVQRRWPPRAGEQQLV